MKIESVAGALVALVICVVVIALVAIPVVQDSTQGTPYEGSNLVYDYKVIEIESSPTFTWSSTGATSTITYGGETDTFTYSGAYVMATDKVQVRVGANGAKTVWNLTDSTSVSIYGTVTLAVTNGSYTLTIAPTGGDTTTATGTISMALIPSNLGTWAHFSSPAVKATLGQKVYFGIWYNPATDGPNRLVSVTDGGEPSNVVSPYVSGNGITAAGADVSYNITYEETGGHQAVGYYSKVVSSWTTGGGVAMTSTGIDTYAPIGYESTTVDGENVASGTDSMLLAVIPILLIIVAIMVAVRVMKEA